MSKSIDDLVAREVYYNVTELVFKIYIEEIDEWSHVFSQPDWENAAFEYINHEMSETDLRDYLYTLDEDVSHIPTGELDSLRKRLLLLLDRDRFQEFSLEFDLEPEYYEVFEFWLISDWLARKLEAKGEIITFDFYGLTIWGRTTTGQSISLDNVISEIFTELQ